MIQICSTILTLILLVRKVKYSLYSQKRKINYKKHLHKSNVSNSMQFSVQIYISFDKSCFYEHDYLVHSIPWHKSEQFL